MRNFNKGYKIYHNLQKTETNKRAFINCANAIMDYKEANPTATDFNIGKVLKLMKNKKYDELYCYLNNWLMENEKENYDGENWYGETYQ